MPIGNAHTLSINVIELRKQSIIKSPLSSVIAESWIRCSKFTTSIYYPLLHLLFSILYSQGTIINFKYFSLLIVGNFLKYKKIQQNNKLLSSYHQVSTLTNIWSILFTELLYFFYMYKESELEYDNRYSNLYWIELGLEA